METNLEQIIESVRTLPFEDLDRLREVIEEEREQKKLAKKDKSDLKKESQNLKRRKNGWTKIVKNI